MATTGPAGRTRRCGGDRPAPGAVRHSPAARVDGGPAAHRHGQCRHRGHDGLAVGRGVDRPRLPPAAGRPSSMARSSSPTTTPRPVRSTSTDRRSDCPRPSAATTRSGCGGSATRPPTPPSSPSASPPTSSIATGRRSSGWAPSGRGRFPSTPTNGGRPSGSAVTSGCRGPPCGRPSSTSTDGPRRLTTAIGSTRDPRVRRGRLVRGPVRDPRVPLVLGRQAHRTGQGRSRRGHRSSTGHRGDGSTGRGAPRCRTTEPTERPSTGRRGRSRGHGVDQRPRCGVGRACPRRSLCSRALLRPSLGIGHGAGRPTTGPPVRRHQMPHRGAGRPPSRPTHCPGWR